MFLYVGAEFSIPLSRVIAIIDAASMAREPETRSFVEQAKRRREVRDVSGEDEVASYVITETLVYASSLTSATLKKRAERGWAGGLIDNEI